MNKVFIIFILSTLPVFAFGQNFSKLLKQGSKHYNKGEVNKALEYYLEAEKLEPGNVELNLHIGRAYLLTDYKHLSLSYLTKVSKLAPKLEPHIEFFLGLSCQYNYLFEDAITHFENYGKLYKYERDLVHKKVRECKNADSLIREPVAVDIVNLGPLINSPDQDYVPIITPDESTLVFTSRREGSTGGQRTKDNELYEDIYISYNLGNQWIQAQPISSNINTRFHDATAAITANGKELYLYREEGEGDIFHSVFDGKEWSKPVGLPYPINTEHWETAVSVTPDGKTIYFASDRPGGFGGLDLYTSEMQADGLWGPPINLGSQINTAGHEDSPYIHPDLQTLFFSSDTHPGLGGYDVFQSQWKDGTWQKPTNMGYPINSPDNNFHFIMAKDRKHAYYSSIQDGGYGKSDIYRIAFLDQTLKPLLEAPRQKNLASQVYTKQDSTSAVAFYSGQLVDAESGTPLQGLVSISHNTTGDLIARVESASDGNFTIILPQAGTYGLSAEADGYLISSRKIQVSKTKEQQKIATKIKMNPLKVGLTTIMANIFFDSGKSSLQTESLAELEKIKEFLASSPTLKVRINGHTDNIGNATVNKILSKKRAQAVIDFLVQQGVEGNRLSAEGYGQERPIVSNDDEKDGRELNRRTEIEVVSL